MPYRSTSKPGWGISIRGLRHYDSVCLLALLSHLAIPPDTPEPAMIVNASKTSRRQFVQTSAALGFGYWIADRAAAESKSPNEIVAFACIGLRRQRPCPTPTTPAAIGRRGGRLRRRCHASGRRPHRFPKARKFTRLPQTARRDAQEHRRGDGEHARPYPRPGGGHGHADGQALLLQKPLTHSLYEARLLAELAREKKVATQMGNQGTAASSLRRRGGMMRGGLLGPVSEVHVWTDRPIWPQGVRPACPLPPPE